MPPIFEMQGFDVVFDLLSQPSSHEAFHFWIFAICLSQSIWGGLVIGGGGVYVGIFPQWRDVSISD